MSSALHDINCSSNQREMFQAVMVGTGVLEAPFLQARQAAFDMHAGLQLYCQPICAPDPVLWPLYLPHT